MKLADWSLLVTLTLVGCSAATSSIEVRIAPDYYQVGNVRSALATPVVDEVLHLNPQNVLMVMCPSTPPAKVIQFQTELSVRSKAKVQGAFVNKGCFD